MPLSINTNIASMTAQRSFLNSNNALETAFERLSTGKRVNSAVDDAAGLSIGKAMEARVSGLNQAIRNVNDGISMVQIAEGALDEVTTILQRMRDLSVQASNGSLGTTEKSYIDTEQAKLATAMNTVLQQAKFDSQSLFTVGSNGSTQKTVAIQSGADATNSTTNIVIDDLSAEILGVNDGALITTHETITFAAITDAQVAAADTSIFFKADADATGGDLNLSVDLKGVTTVSALVDRLNDQTTAAVAAFTFTHSGGVITATSDAAGNLTQNAYNLELNDGGVATDFAGSISEGGTTDAGLAAIDSAMAIVAEDRATLGATQMQLESTVRNLANVAENTAAAASRIMDTDYAAETANLTKAQILQQAATSVLAQANAQPQAVLALLQ